MFQYIFRLVSSSKALNPPVPARSITPTFDKNVVKKPKLDTSSSNIETNLKKDAGLIFFFSN
jgi:hypothetical protein